MCFRLRANEVDGDYVCTGLSVGLGKLILVHVKQYIHVLTCIHVYSKLITKECQPVSEHAR